MLYIDDQDCDGACHLENYSFVITYLLEDEQELSLGMLDTSQTYLFDAPCLFIDHLLCVLLHFVAFLYIFWN
jgi:hypothetical protein